VLRGEVAQNTNNELTMHSRSSDARPSETLIRLKLPRSEG
jgi:hypothetical protein